MLGVSLMGFISNKHKTAYNFLKNNVNKNPSWQVQEFLAKAFDSYCENSGYEKSLKIIEEWLNNKNENNRRAVTEGLRIWTNKSYFKDNPEEAIRILSKHKTDESEYVRKSVGNALRDISKKHPELIKRELNEWKLETKEIKQVYKLASKFIEK
jgi:3-methyladenine DNA glycosylase AlkC